MPLDRTRCRPLLQSFDFTGLFIEELGWDTHKATHEIPLPGRSVRLEAIAHKRGFVAWHCPTAKGSIFPDAAARRRIEREATKAAHEHLIVFTDAGNSRQIWQWVRRDPGQPLRVREVEWTRGQSGEVILQKLDPLFVSFDEEESITLLEVAGRARTNVNERVTKKFYADFTKQHTAFLKFITGIPNQGDHEWYASVMLNRLMFVYFVQRKGFLDGDTDYLRNRLNALREKNKGDKFYSFYRYFLVKLFHQGLGGKARKPELEKLIGRVPYLNGGIFDVHQLESDYGDAIHIPDKAFEAIFDYFDRYQWHLDERPLHADNEINPDVLGYIFEKYINQKQMGAYYTKEDITEYISKSTIIPFLFDAARAKCKVAFENPHGPTIWDLLRENPDRYIYAAAHHGTELQLPPEIAAGLDATKPNLIERRQPWNKPAPTEFALPTEIWREVVARRQRCEEVRRKLADGEVREVNDFITLNLDLRQFAQDVIQNCEGPDLLMAFWNAISTITVLDPTGGSGAFIFAALNILEPLYEACLGRMEAFHAEWGEEGKKTHPNYHKKFTDVLARVDAHPNRRYFVLKSIILNNLYAVDIMEEAVEICKLRLFLKLAAQVEPDAAKDNLGIEPLPDIDFNIRAGNTLVGYTTRGELEAVGNSDWILKEQVKEVLEAAEDAAKLYECFLECQVEGDQSPADFKAKLRLKFDHAREKCDRFLAESYELGLSKNEKKFDAWKKTHQPFHWFIEFYGILNGGGFDVIVGNPPWVEFAKVQKQYSLKGFSTIDCNNLWAFVVERSFILLAKGARHGLIVPMSLVCTERMSPIQQLVKAAGLSWLSNFESDSNPGQLFHGVKQNVTILIGKCDGEEQIFTTRLFRFFQDYRDYVFPTVEFVEWSQSNPLNFGFPKVSTDQELRVISKMFAKSRLGTQMTATGSHPVLVHRIAHYYIKCFDFVPYFKSQRDGVKKSEDYKEYLFRQPLSQFVAAINSTSFYFYWQVFFDAFKAGKLCVESFPFGNPKDSGTQDELVSLAKRLMRDVKSNSTRLKAQYAATGSVEYDQFYPRNSKPILDEIDTVLAAHYGFTVEELDFILNYDIKYRLGRTTEDE